MFTPFEMKANEKTYISETFKVYEKVIALVKIYFLYFCTVNKKICLFAYQASSHDF